MDWKKEIKETILYIIVGIVLAYSINTGLGWALSTEKPVMAVVSDSMEPTFYKGDLVVVKGVDIASLAEGDIIVYYNPSHMLSVHKREGIYVVHRIVGRQKCGLEVCFITKGDNNATNPFSDQKAGIAAPVKGELVKGKVVLIIPKLGWFRVLVSDIFQLS